jgi:hypothetical protein
MRRQSGKRSVWQLPRVLSAALAVAVVVGLSAGVCLAQGGGTSSSNEPLFIKNLHITGYYQNTSATWINSSNIAGFYGTASTGPFRGNSDRFGQRSENSLVQERQLLQLDVNDDFTENDSMFMRSWFVYEPSYPWEQHCVGPGGGNTWLGTITGKTGAVMDCPADFYNQYGIRELWFKHRWGPLQLFLGRQIVTWGESLAFRVGDQINPQDLSWTFAFANLEQSRTPLWMLHPILNLPSLGPLSSNFAELIYIPGFDFLYTQVDYTTDSLDGLNNIAGRVNIGGSDPGGRFAGQLDCRTVGAGGAFGGGAGVPGACGALTPIAIYQTATGFPGQGGGAYIGVVDSTIPNATWDNSQVGFRLHTLAYNTEMTAFYLYSHEYSPVLKIPYSSAICPFASASACGIFQSGVTPIGPTYLRRELSVYPRFSSLGVTANRPLYLPGALSQLPFVIRAEMFYKNHQNFDTNYLPGSIFTNFNPRAGTPNGLYYSDTIKWLFALDLDSAYTPWLTTTGNLSANYELTDTWTLSPSSHQLAAATYLQPAYHHDMAMLINVGTSWWWGAVAPTWTSEYAPQGTTFLFFPTLALTPPWTNKYFMSLRWVEILGSDRYNLDGGLFKGKSMFVSQFEYNFSLL